MQIRPFKVSEEADVIELWRTCELIRPANDSAKDIRRKLRVNPEWFLVGSLNDKIIATVMAGYEGHRGWINYLAVHPNHRFCGYGRHIMTEAERLLRAVGCPKINLQVRSSNAAVLEFYRHIGYVVDDVISLGKRLESDEQKL
jgi:ribosomal protein S18 acetylase RimI-like enzyme